MRFVSVLISFTSFLLLACMLSGCRMSLVKESHEPPDLTGFSKEIQPRAQILYAEAYLLWQNRESANPASTEICSQPAAAVDLLDRVIALEPQYAPAYTRRGLALSELGAFEEAFDDASTGIRLSPTPEAYAYRGLISLRARQFQAARKDLEYSLELQSSQYPAWNLLGVTALAEGNTGKACKSFEKACSYGDCSRLEQARAENICR